MDPISTEFAGDLRAQTKDVRSRPRGYLLPRRVSQSSEMTAMSRARTEPKFHPNTRRCWRAGSAVPWRAASRREAHWVQIAETEREVTTLDLPPAATRLLIDFLKVIGGDKGVTLVRMEAEITTPQAADLLNVSPPYIGGLVDKGALPARMVRNQRRLLWRH